MLAKGRRHDPLGVDDHHLATLAVAGVGVILDPAHQCSRGRIVGVEDGGAGLFTGNPWSQATVAQAEGSVLGVRVRHFTATELVALARVFDLPVLYFFMPPDEGAEGLGTADSPAKGWAWEYLLMLVWGHARNFGAVAERAAPWAHASTVVTVPEADVLDGVPDDALLAKLSRERERYTPEDMLAVAFNGLARRKMRGSMQRGEKCRRSPRACGDSPTPSTRSTTTGRAPSSMPRN
ncbi:MAG: hypothetical protein ACRD0D_08020 [Acidimicrobiales bacterium]